MSYLGSFLPDTRSGSSSCGGCRPSSSKTPSLHHTAPFSPNEYFDRHPSSLSSTSAKRQRTSPPSSDFPDTLPTPPARTHTTPHKLPAPFLPEAYPHPDAIPTTPFSPKHRVGTPASFSYPDVLQSTQHYSLSSDRLTTSAHSNLPDTPGFGIPTAILPHRNIHPNCYPLSVDNSTYLWSSFFYPDMTPYLSSDKIRTRLDHHKQYKGLEDVYPLEDLNCLHGLRFLPLEKRPRRATLLQKHQLPVPTGHTPIPLRDVDANPIPHYYNDPYLQTGAFYGRAVATLRETIHRQLHGTGWNTGGPYLATAGHNDTVVGFFEANFGRYGNLWTDENNITNAGVLNQGAIELQQKLQQLGIPFDKIVRVDNRTIPLSQNWQALSSLMNDWNCSLERTYFPPSLAIGHPGVNCGGMSLEQQINARDISFYRCSGKRVWFQIPTTTGISKTIQTILWPSNLFGYIPISTDRWKQVPPMQQSLPDPVLGNTPMYLLGHNVHRGNPSPYVVPPNQELSGHVYLSPGRFYGYRLIDKSTRAGTSSGCRGQSFAGTDYYSWAGTSGSALVIPFDYTRTNTHGTQI